MLPSLPKGDVINPPPGGLHFGLFSVTRCWFVLTHTNFLASMCTFTVLPPPAFPFLFPTCLDKWAPSSWLFQQPHHSSVPQDIRPAPPSNVTSSMKFFPAWPGRVNHTQWGGDRIIWGQFSPLALKCSESRSVVPDSAIPWTIQSMEFSRPEYWSGQPFPSPGDLPNPEIEPRSPALQADSLPAEPPGKPSNTYDLDSLLDFSNSQVSLLKNKVVIIIPMLQGCCKIWIFKLLAMC